MTTTLRPARAEDCERVWTWSCAPEVRALSLDPRPVPYEEHAAWFTRRLATPRAPTWIVEEDDAPVGVVRLDPRGPAARISIALDPGARGRGIGRRAVAAACTAWRAPIVAEVLPVNAPSHACFAACGFVAIDRSPALVTYRWSP